MTTSESSIEIRTVTEEDGPAITALFDQVFNQKMSLAQWAWKYRRPFYQQLFSAVAVDGKGSIAGHVGAIPLAGADRGRDMPAWQLTDAMVHPAYRGHDLFRSLLRHVGSSINSTCNRAVIYAFAGPDSTKIGIKKGILADKSKVRCYRLDTALTSAPAFGWSLEPVSFSDNRLSALWIKQSRNLAAFTRRDGEYITWRYALNPFHRYQAALVTRLFRSVGWLIWRQDDDGIKLVDYCIRPSHFDSALSLLARYEATQDTIRFWAPDSLASGIRTALIAEETPICLMLLNTGDERHILDDMGKDYLFTMGDADIY